MKSQMRNGGDEGINLFEIRFRPRSANLVKQISKKAWSISRPHNTSFGSRGMPPPFSRIHCK
jgi:hypothetical protein